MEATRPGAGSVPPTLGRPQRWLPGQALGPGPQHHPTARRTGTRVPSPADGADGTRHVGSPPTWEPRELVFFFLFLKKQKKNKKDRTDDSVRVQVRHFRGGRRVHHPHFLESRSKLQRRSRGRQ